MKYIGTETIQIQPGYPDLKYGSDGVISGQIVYGGIYVDLLKALPKCGELLDDLPVSGLRVVEARLKPTKGTLGLLTLDVATPPVGSEDKTVLSETMEVDVGTLEKPLATHPIFSSLSTQDLAHVALWEGLGPDCATRRSGYQYPIVSNADPANASQWASLSGAAQVLAYKKAKGIESYLLPVPVIRRTREYSKQPTSVDVGKICVPPASAGGTWVYLKTSDKATRSGKHGPWQRTEEWTGADSWDTDLYSQA